jgi:hypothetical protein
MYVTVPYSVAAAPARGRQSGRPAGRGTVRVYVDAPDPLAAALGRVRALHAGAVRFAGHPRAVRLTATELRRFSYGTPYIATAERLEPLAA